MKLPAGGNVKRSTSVTGLVVWLMGGRLMTVQEMVSGRESSQWGLGTFLTLAVSFRYIWSNIR